MKQVRYSNIEASTVEESRNDSEHKNEGDHRASNRDRASRFGWHVFGVAAIGAMLLVGGLSASTFARKGSHALRLSASSVVNLESSRDKDPWDIVGSLGPHAYDIKQGSIGTCYVLAAFIAIAKAQPQIIEHAFLNKQKWNDAVPVYETMWDVGGFPMTVSLDNMAPANDQGFFFVGLPFGKRVEEHLWPVLLEKAYAKIHGSYFSTSYGNLFEVLRGLTMAPTSGVQFISQDSKGKAFPYNMSACSDMWDTLTYVTKHKFPVTFAVLREDGFVPNQHAYAFLGTEVVVSKDGVEQKVARVYNPHGLSLAYTGKLPKGDTATEGGEFRMLFDEEFCHDATLIDVATVYSASHRMTNQPIELKHYPAGSVAARHYKFKLESDQQFNIAVQWVSQRMREHRFGCKVNTLLDMAVMVVLTPKGEYFSRNNFNVDGDKDADDEEGGSNYIQLFLDGISNPQAVPGEYEVFFAYGTNSKADHVALNFYALDKIKVEEVPVDMTQVQAGTDNLCSKRQVCTKVVSEVMGKIETKHEGEVCDTSNFHHLQHVLGNSDQIQKDGADKHFPTTMESITSNPNESGACGGDAAAGQGDADCEVYNHWLPIKQVVANHFGSVAQVA